MSNISAPSFTRRTVLTSTAQQQEALATSKTNLKDDEELSQEWVRLQQAIVQ